MNIKHNKEEAINAGVLLFWHKGYNNVGVAEICEEIEMAKGAFYHAFKSKENFLLSCIESYGESNTQYLSKLLYEQDISAFKRIEKMYESMLVLQYDLEYAGCMTNNMMSELGSINAAVGEATAKMFDALIKAIEPVVKQAQLEGDISPTLDSRSVTELIHSTFFGVLTTTKSTQDYQKAISTMKLLLKSLKTV